MDDVLTEIPPPSRFFQEDLDIFASPPPPLPSPFLLLNPNPNPNLLIISLSPASVYLLSLLPSKTLIGTLIVPEIPLSGISIPPSTNNRSCNLYSVDNNSTFLLTVQYPVSPERTRAVAKCLIRGVSADRVLIVDSIKSQNYRGRITADETLAFKLETAEQRRSAGDRIVNRVDYLPSGSVMDGFGAAILAECQMRKIKGTLLAIWPENGGFQVLKNLFTDLLKFDFGEIEGEAAFRCSSHTDSDLYT